MSLTRTEADAGDLVQDTFVKWAEKGGQLRDSSKVKGWLFTTLHRHFLEKERRTSRFPHLEISEAEAELTEVSPPSSDRLDLPRVLQALSELEPGYRAAVALFYLEDCSHAEIANILEVPVGTVKSRISRGISQLKHHLAERAGGPGA